MNAGNLVCRDGAVNHITIGTTRLKRLQKEVENDSCNPGQHGNSVWEGTLE